MGLTTCLENAYVSLVAFCLQMGQILPPCNPIKKLSAWPEQNPGNLRAGSSWENPLLTCTYPHKHMHLIFESDSSFSVCRVSQEGQERALGSSSCRGQRISHKLLCVNLSEKDMTASNSLWSQKPCAIICMFGERKCVNCFPISEVTRK